MRSVLAVIALPLTAFALIYSAGCKDKPALAAEASASPASAKASTASDSGLTISTSGEGNEHANIRLDGSGLKIEGSDGKGSSVNLEAKFDKFNLDVHADGKHIRNGVNISSADVGLDFYPGSEPVPAASFAVDGPEETARVSTRTTPDSPDEVKAFYESQSHWTSRSQTNSNGDIEIVLLEGENSREEHRVEIQRDKDDRQTTINVSRVVRNGKTS